MNSRLNPGLLKLELFCKGAKLDDSCEVEKDGRMILRTRAGLGSGLEVILPDELYTNIPVVEHFVKDTPFTILKRNGQYWVQRNGQDVCPIRLPHQPNFYNRKTSSGTQMVKVGLMQGTTLAVYPTKVCGYWTTDPRVNCRFCATGLNVGVTEQAEKSVQDVVETALAAREEEKVTFVHFNAGYYDGHELEILEPFVHAVKRETKLLVGVQCPPNRDLKQYDWLKKSGADHFSFCYELHNPKIFAEVCPGKQETLGQQAFFNALEYTSKLYGKGKISGEIIAGIEPLEDTFKAIDYITGIGAFPTICVFRPTVGTDYESKPSPRYEDMLLVFRHMYEACKRNGIPTGIAPNIKTSLVVLPYEGRYFAKTWDMSDVMYSFKLGVLRVLFGAYFRMRLRMG